MLNTVQINRRLQAKTIRWVTEEKRRRRKNPRVRGEEIKKKRGRNKEEEGKK